MLFFQIFIPILLLLVLAPFTQQMDLAFENYFYFVAGNGSFSPNAFYDFIYDWTVYPAQIVAILAVFCFIFSFFVKSLKPLRRYALLLIVPMALGAGILTHAVFKDHWGRPRPKQIEQFGGTESFRAFYDPKPSISINHQHKSFPCGHCTMGFYFFSIALLGRRLASKNLYYGGLFLALILGSLLGLARMAQGGHFFSDVLVSAIIMWECALLTEQWLWKKRQVEASSLPFKKRRSVFKTHLI